MNVYRRITTLRGTKETVLKILNTAIKNVGNGEPIGADDDLETINRKIKSADGTHSLGISYCSLLDAEAMNDAVLQKRKQRFLEDFGQDYDFGRWISIRKVTDTEAGYAVEFSSVMDDNNDGPFDWAGWEDICKAYDCIITTDIYDDVENKYDTTVLFEMFDGIVETSLFDRDRHIIEYDDFYYRLMDLDAERYRSLKIADLENQVNRIREEINREKINVIKSHLAENNGHAVIPEDIDEIVDGAFQCCKELKSIELHKGIKSIGRYAFEWCANLESIDVPEGVAIGEHAFDNTPFGPKTPETKPACGADDDWINEIL